ncbi:MAG: AraC family transcriptional regulator, partial [Pseudomonadota bacterium]|nr:AraC family transcriptional regulator [Pseudomonadota bacterium]
MQDPAGFEIRFHQPSPAAAGLIARIAGYREHASATLAQREAASLVVPLVISLGSPFSIALGRDPGIGDRQPSFAAGLYAGPVHIVSDGAAECIQVDFTPPGAYAFFGGAVPELTARMVDIDAILGAPVQGLRQRLAETVSWQRRFELAEAFV